MIEIREASPQDSETVRRLTAAVFTEYEGLQKLLPKFFATPGVTTYLASEADQVVGMVMLGFLPWTGGKKGDDSWIGDLLAIGVDPAAQRRGIGSELMARAFELTREMQEWRDLVEIQLTLDAANQAARRFFEKHGFCVAKGTIGAFAGGQSAVRMTKRLS